MANLEDHDRRRLVLDGVNDSIFPYPDPVQVSRARQLLAAGRARVLRERLDSGDDALTFLLLANRLDLLGGRLLDGKAIPSHAV